MEDASLSILFERARNIHQTATKSTVNQELLQNGLQALEKCEDLISKLGLFSPNETIDDISTLNLKYILVPFYLAELTEKTTIDVDRIKILSASYSKLKEFVTFCEAMDLIPTEESPASHQGAANNFADRRAQKIARFRRQKAAEAKLQEITERKENIYDDGEDEREAWLALISLCLYKSFGLLEMLTKEEEMLRAVKERQLKEEGNGELSRAILDERAKKAEAWHRDSASRVHRTEPAQPIACATFAQDVLEGRANIKHALSHHTHHHLHRHQPMIFGPASLVGQNLSLEKEHIAAQVFQPSHRLPTMSIEEAGLREMEMMNKWKERNAKLVEEANSAWYKDRLPSKAGTRKKEEEEDDDDETINKARAWDDWKDEHPRGAGNTKLTPCG